jgi:short-subunit dehydrogenase
MRGKMNSNETVVLITGCSSGIGAALCEEFHQKGCRVIATARRLESLEKLQSKGMEIQQLDVNNQDDIERIAHTYSKRGVKIDILINNAGFAVIGPTIELSDADLRSQLETNVIAPLALIREIAPAMRENGNGVIVNIGSISGLVSTPFSGAYCASKAALHALSDTLRMELAPFKIKVVTVQPGAIKSRFGEAASKRASDLLKPESWYTSVQDKIINRAEISQVDATPANEFTKKLVKLLLKNNPPPIIRLGKKSLFLPAMKFLLPRSVFDHILNKKFGLTLMNQENSS